MIIKGWEYIQAKVIALLILSLNRKIFDGLKKNIIDKKKRSKKAVLVPGNETLICSLEAKVDT